MKNIQIGFAISEARKVRGITAKDLAALSGLSTTALSKIEGGTQSLSFASGIAIAKALGITANDLVDRIESVTSKVLEVEVQRKMDNIRKQFSI